MDRLDIYEASKQMGISKEALRKRISRGTVKADKGEDGRWYVILPSIQDDLDDRQEIPQGSIEDYLRSTREEVSWLREELRKEREIRSEENKRRDTIESLLIDLQNRLPLPDEKASDKVIAIPRGESRIVVKTDDAAQALQNANETSGVSGDKTEDKAQKALDNAVAVKKDLYEVRQETKKKEDAAAKQHAEMKEMIEALQHKKPWWRIW